MEKLDEDEEGIANARRDALIEVQAHLSKIRMILVPLLILEEQRDQKARQRAQKNQATQPHHEQVA